MFYSFVVAVLSAVAFINFAPLFLGVVTAWFSHFSPVFGAILNYIAGLAFFTSATGVLQKLVVGLGAGLGIWGVINLMEGYGNDNPGAKSQGMKQLIAGGGVALIGITLVPLLANIFS